MTGERKRKGVIQEYWRAYYGASKTIDLPVRKGNRTLPTNNATGDYATCIWGQRNRLTQVREHDSQAVLQATVSHKYDTQSRWIERNVDGTITRFVYDGNQIVLAMDSQNQAIERYLWGPAVDMLLAEEEVSGSATARWALGDHQNSLRDYVSYEGTAIADHLVYNAFGLPLSPSAVDHLFGYTGRPTDHATGLQNNLHRWYDPELHQWLSEDPKGFAAGDANLRRYAVNDPVNRIDPEGLDWLSSSNTSAFGLKNNVMWNARKSTFLGFGTKESEQWAIGEDFGDFVKIHSLFGGGWIRKDILAKIAARNEMLGVAPEERIERISQAMAGWSTHVNLSVPSLSAPTKERAVIRGSIEHPAADWVNNKLAAVKEWFTVDPMRTADGYNDSHHSRAYHRIVKPAVVDNIHGAGSSAYWFAMAEREDRSDVVARPFVVGWQLSTDSNFRADALASLDKQWATMSQLDRQDAAVKFAGSFILSEFAFVKLPANIPFDDQLRALGSRGVRNTAQLTDEQITMLRMSADR